MDVNSELLDKSYDENLQQIPQIKWLPWIGKNFSRSAQKTLIIGESVYNWKPNDLVTEELINKSDNLRRLHINHALNYKRKSKYVRNIERAIFNHKRPSDEHKKELWSSVVYHNLVLRMMKTKKHRPNYEDYLSGWEVVDNLVSELKADQILVYGLEWAKRKSLIDYAKSKNYQLLPLGKSEKISRSQPRRYILKKEDREITLTMIRHPSSYFSWKKWTSIVHPMFQANTKVILEK